MVDSGTIESLAECVASVPRVTIVNNTMNKKQWARFAVEMNRTEKRIKSLGEEAEQRCQCDISRYDQSWRRWRMWRLTRAATSR